MKLTIDRQMVWLVEGVVAGLIAASLTGFLLSQRVKSESAKATVANLNARIRAWWVMIGVFALALLVGRSGALLLFAFISFLALREYVSLIPTVLADHRTLFWSFFVFTPLQYWILYRGWYGMASIMIPVYAFLFIPVRLVLAGETSGFLDRAARIHWGLMVCVYCLSYAPALLILDIPGYQRQSAKLLLFLVMVAQFSDIFQYIWGKLLGKRKIAPSISPIQNLGGIRGWHHLRHSSGHGTVVDDTLFASRGARYGAGGGLAGLCRRVDHVRHQTRPRGKGFRHDHRGPRWDSGSRRFHLLLRADILPPDAIHLSDYAWENPVKQSICEIQRHTFGHFWRLSEGSGNQKR
jgi:phosphatidate cytidylyltransferase